MRHRKYSRTSRSNNTTHSLSSAIGGRKDLGGSFASPRRSASRLSRFGTVLRLRVCPPTVLPLHRPLRSRCQRRWSQRRTTRLFNSGETWLPRARTTVPPAAPYNQENG